MKTTSGTRAREAAAVWTAEIHWPVCSLEQLFTLAQELMAQLILLNYVQHYEAAQGNLQNVSFVLPGPCKILTVLKYCLFNKKQRTYFLRFVYFNMYI